MSEDPTTEPELWERARRSDGDAFGRLFDRHRDRVHRRALGLTGDRHDAEDLTAAAFFELWRRRRSVTLVNGSVLPWLLVTCVSAAGMISVPSTSGFHVDPDGTPHVDETTGSWDCAVVRRTTHIRDGYLAPRSTSITVTADPGTTWTAVARYGTSTTRPFDVNAHGQTYGEPNGIYGDPDLQGAQTTDRKVGYVYTKDFQAFRGCGYLPVYESDGTTVIGRFPIGIDPVTGATQCDSNGDPTPDPTPAG